MAQGISYDKQEVNGDRVIVTSLCKFAKQKSSFLSGSAEWNVMMKYISVNKKYGICIPLISMNRENLSAGRKLLIKFENDSTLELSNINNILTSDNTFDIIGGITFYNLYPIYDVSTDKLNLIMKNRVTKLRIEVEWGKGYIDIEQNDYKKIWNFSGVVNDCYNAIKKRLSVNNDIHNGF